MANEFFAGTAVGGPCDGMHLESRVPFYYAPVPNDGPPPHGDEPPTNCAPAFQYRFVRGEWIPAKDQR
jgi:hypothetical protein